MTRSTNPQRSHLPFLVWLFGMTITGTALLLLVPSLFEPHEPGKAWLVATVGAACVVFTVGTIVKRPRDQ